MKTIFILFLTVLASTLGYSQTSVYMRLIDYNGNNIYGTTTSFQTDPKATPGPGKITHADEVALTTYTDGDKQTLNIGSQSTGAGAGKITYDSLTFSKSPDEQSGKFFEMMASGTPFKFVEFSFYKTSGTNDYLYYKIRLSLVAFKYIQRAAAACSGNCPDLIENFAMEYGAKYIVYYPQKQDGSYGTPVGGGWDRVKNVSWNGVNAIQ